MYVHTEKFIKDVTYKVNGVWPRLTIDYGIDKSGLAGFSARIVDGYRDVTMQDVNGQHYLVGKGETIELALAELEHQIELQYC